MVIGVARSIRYGLGDSITLSPDPCPCGSALPAIRVEGRRDEILSCQAPGGEIVKLPPRALANAVEATAGVRRSQVIQTAPEVLTVRLEAAPGFDSLWVWERTIRRLRGYLSAQGLPSTEVNAGFFSGLFYRVQGLSTVAFLFMGNMGDA